MKFLPPELISRFLLPVVRREISTTLLEKGYKQSEIAEEIGITQSAISQYVNTKRAKFDLYLNDNIVGEIRRAADRIMNGSSSEIEIMNICDLIIHEGILCEIHSKLEEIPEECPLCKNNTPNLRGVLDLTEN